MAKLTDEQLLALIYTAGVTDKNDAQTMVNIAKCESSSDPESTNKNTNGTTDVGLWQINSTHLTEHPNWTAEWLKIPGNNAIAAANLYHSRKFDDWDASKSCWASKPHSGFLPQWVPLNTVPNLILDKVFGVDSNDQSSIPIYGDLVKTGNAVTTGIQTTADATVSAAQGAIKAGQWLSNPHNWLRIMYVGLGAAVVVVGLAKLVAYDSGLSPFALAKKAPTIPEAASKVRSKSKTAEEGVSSESE